MVTMIISFLVVVLSFNFFIISYQINGVNRLVLGMPISLYENSINMFGILSAVGPAFNKSELETNITSYFDYHMPRYTNEYELSFYYYKIEDHSLDMTTGPKAVEITVKAELAMFTHYQRTMYYEIRRN